MFDYQFFIEVLVGGLLSGVMYSLVAIGFVLIYKTSGVLNFAQGAMLLFAALILRGFWIALHARDRFGSLMVVGVMTLVGLQTFLNIGVVTGLLPTTGISLPFFSYGGTALSIQLAEMGIVLSVSRQMKPTKAG